MEDELISELIQALDFVSSKNKNDAVALNEEYKNNSNRISELEVQLTLQFLDKEIQEVEDFAKSLFLKTGLIWHNVKVFTHSEASELTKTIEAFYCNRVTISYNLNEETIIQKADFIEEARDKIKKSIKEEITALSDRNVVIQSLLKKVS